MPKDTPQQIFKEMVKAGFDPIKAIIEREDLDETLTADDVQKVTEAIGKWAVNYVEFLKMAKRQPK